MAIFQVMSPNPPMQVIFCVFLCIFLGNDFKKSFFEKKPWVAAIFLPKMAKIKFFDF